MFFFYFSSFLFSSRFSYWTILRGEVLLIKKKHLFSLAFSHSPRSISLFRFTIFFSVLLCVDIYKCLKEQKNMKKFVLLCVCLIPLFSKLNSWASKCDDKEERAKKVRKTFFVVFWIGYATTIGHKKWRWKNSREKTRKTHKNEQFW